MRKLFLCAVALCVAALIGLAIFGKRNSSEPQPVSVAETPQAQTAAEEAVAQPTAPATAEAQQPAYYTASVRLAPIVGTNIATPDQFKQFQNQQ